MAVRYTKGKVVEIIEELEAENKRLREALESIYNRGQLSVYFDCADMQAVAKEALLNVQGDE